MNSSFFACILKAICNIKATINHTVVAAVFIVVVAVFVLLLLWVFVVVSVTFNFLAAVLLLFLGVVRI